MLRRQKRSVEFTGGLEALSLQDYQVDLLASLKPRPNMFFAYDPRTSSRRSSRGSAAARGRVHAKHHTGCGATA
jgi:hypothetical protein